MASAGMRLLDFVQKEISNLRIVLLILRIYNMYSESWESFLSSFDISAAFYKWVPAVENWSLLFERKSERML